MSNIASNTYTGTITNQSITINAASGFTKVSVMWISGTVSVTGGGVLNGVASSAISLSSSLPGVTIAVDTNQVSGVTITCSSGSYAILASS